MNKSRWFPIVLLMFCAASPTLAAGYRLDLEVRPTAPFPFLNRFGHMNVTVFPGGVRGETALMKGFSKTGEGTVTLFSPVTRLYAEVPIRQITSVLLKLGGSRDEIMPGLADFPVTLVGRGTVGGIAANQYRIILGESSIDVWTSPAIPPNPQFNAIVSAALSAVSRRSESLMKRIPGTILYVEMNTNRFKKLTLVRTRSLVRSSQGEKESLETGPWYKKVPFSDSLLQ